MPRPMLPTLLGCLAVVLAAAMPALAADIEDLPVRDLAAQSTWSGKLSRAQAADLLQRAINQGVARKVLLRYAGVRPVLRAKVTATEVGWNLERFMDFSRPPVEWTPQFFRMRSFSARWGAVDEVRAVKVTEREIGSPLVYYGLTFHVTSGKDGGDHTVPLTLKPGGYEIADVLQAALTLRGDVEAAESAATRAPAPPNTPTPAPVATPDLEPDPRPSPVAPTPEPATPVPPAGNMEVRLQQLKQLYDAGLISPDVYKQKQQAILDDL